MDKMDSYLIDYCKQNKILYANYTYKLQGLGAFYVFMKLKKNTTKEVVYRIDLGNIYKPFAKLLREKSYKEIPSFDGYVMYMYKNNTRIMHNTFITKLIIYEILGKDYPDFPICLKKDTNPLYDDLIVFN